MLKSTGDKIQPCLNPQFTSNQSVLCELTRTQEDTELYIDLTAFNI